MVASDRLPAACADYCSGVSGEEGGAPRITLIGKPGCHLCDDARDVVLRVAGETGAGVRELSILDDPALMERYAEQIPVVLVDGDEHDFWRVDEERLRAALTLSPPHRPLLGGRRGWFGRRAR